MHCSIYLNIFLRLQDTSVQYFQWRFCEGLHVPIPNLSIPMLSIRTVVMEYIVCRSTRHQGFLSFKSVCAHMSWILSVPLLPSTAHSAAKLRYIDDCAAGFPNAMSERTVTNIKKGKI